MLGLPHDAQVSTMYVTFINLGVRPPPISRLAKRSSAGFLGERGCARMGDQRIGAPRSTDQSSVRVQYWRKSRDPIADPMSDAATSWQGTHSKTARVKTAIIIQVSLIA